MHILSLVFCLCYSRMNFKQEDADLECHVCSLCNLVFSNFDELLSHKEDHDPEIGIHACYLCNEVSMPNYCHKYPIFWRNI